VTRSAAIAGRIREVLLEGHWIANTNFKDQITSLNWNQATQKIGDLNSIAALTFHVNYYLHGLLNAFDTGLLNISDKYSFDLPEIDNEQSWNDLVIVFLSNAELFATQVGQLTDNTLDQPFIEEKYGTYLRNIEAVIEHSYYHLGQVVIIKKLIDRSHS